jgi:hypothetical protein
VSHRPERKDKNCLNCGTNVVGKFCHKCGQENTEPGMTVWGLVSHFFYDITHFDGKYFDTLRFLFRKPGYLSRAFMEGKRASFVDPVKMYIFTSAFFFLLFYSFFLKMEGEELESGIFNVKELSDRLQILDTTSNDYEFKNTYLILNKTDTILNLGDMKAVDRFRDSLDQLLKQKAGMDSLLRKKEQIGLLNMPAYSSRKEYDSLQNLLPEVKKDSRLYRLLAYRQITINEKYGGVTGKYIAHLIDRFLHSFPTLLFVSLPMLALLLTLLYIRRKKFLYVNHGIYLIHLYIFTFILLIPFFLSINAGNYRPSIFWTWLRFGFFIWLMVYLYKSMREFYQQSKAKSIIKMILFLLFSVVINIFIFAIYFAYMALKG